MELEPYHTDLTCVNRDFLSKLNISENGRFFLPVLQCFPSGGCRLGSGFIGEKF